MCKHLTVQKRFTRSFDHRCSVKWDDDSTFYQHGHALSVKRCLVAQALEDTNATFDTFQPAFFDGRGQSYFESKGLHVTSMVCSCPFIN